MGAVLSQSDRRRDDQEDDGNLTFDLPHENSDAFEKAITVRLADCDGQRNTANMLINRKYSARGYGSHHKVPIVSNGVTFTASSKSRLIGTMSLTADSVEGLVSDRTFKSELDKFRAIPGTRLCELTKFAFETSMSSMNLMASLFHIIFIYATRHYGCTDAIIEVSRRHCRFYEAMLGFQRVGEPNVNESVGAASYLMWLDLSDMRRMIDDPKGNGIVSSRSLYPFFFSTKEEEGIYRRLASSVAEPAPLTNENRLRTVIEAASSSLRGRASRELAKKPPRENRPACA